MDNGTYKKNVLRTLSVAPARLGLRLMTRNTARMNVFHAVIGMASETMELQGGLKDYVTGASKLTDGMKLRAFEEAGYLTYYLTVISKFLKVKVPGSGKKVKLKSMTRTEALMGLVVIAGDMLDLAKKYMYGPVMVKSTVKRPVKVYDLDAEGKKIPVVSETPSPGLKKYQFKLVEQDVQVETVDKVATEALWAERDEKLRTMFEGYVSLFWPFVYETWDVPPANLYVGNVAKLSVRYPAGFFELAETQHRDTEAELAAATGQPA